MKRSAMAIMVILGAVAMLLSGCSKDKEREAQLTRLQTQVKELQGQITTAKEQADKASLKAIDEKKQLEDAAVAYQARLTYQPLDAWRISPEPRLENGWILSDGEATYTLKGYANAKSVRFYWKDVADKDARLLGTETSGKNGWTYTGKLPSGITTAFWAEVEYPNGTKELSPVLPIRSTGK